MPFQILMILSYSQYRSIRTSLIYAVTPSEALVCPVLPWLLILKLSAFSTGLQLRVDDNVNLAKVFPRIIVKKNFGRPLSQKHEKQPSTHLTSVKPSLTSYIFYTRRSAWRLLINSTSRTYSIQGDPLEGCCKPVPVVHILYKAIRLKAAENQYLSYIFYTRQSAWRLLETSTSRTYSIQGDPLEGCWKPGPVVHILYKAIRLKATENQYQSYIFYTRRSAWRLLKTSICRTYSI